MSTYSGPTVFAGDNRAEGQEHVAKVLADARASAPLAGLAGVKVGDRLMVRRPGHGVLPLDVTSVRRKYLTAGGDDYEIATGYVRHGYGVVRAETQPQYAARVERAEVQRDLGCRGVETLRARLTTDQLKRILTIAQEETP